MVLPAPFGADHADDAAGRQREAEIVDQQAIAVALAQVRGLDHHVAEARTGRDRDLDAFADAALLLRGAAPRRP